jgi:hypothetical protein
VANGAATCCDGEGGDSSSVAWPPWRPRRSAAAAA